MYEGYSDDRKCIFFAPLSQYITLQDQGKYVRRLHLLESRAKEGMGYSSIKKLTVGSFFCRSHENDADGFLSLFLRSLLPSFGTVSGDFCHYAAH